MSILYYPAPLYMYKILMNLISFLVIDKLKNNLDHIKI